MRRLLREPLVHFLLIGAVLFGLYSLTQSGRPGTAPSKEIRLSLDEIAQLTVLHQSQWRRPPTPQELERMVENKVQQEILYREALAMGLDKDDEIVKRRMAQKMQFLAEDVSAAREPTTAELRSWFEKNSAKFAQPPRLSFRHLYFSPDRRGAARETMRSWRWRSLSASRLTRSSRARLPTRSCSRTTTAIARPTTSARNSDRCSPWRWPSFRPARGRGPSSPASAGTLCSSTP